MTERVDVAVIGAGVAGLSAAYAAQRAGASVAVLDAQADVGGVMRSERIDGFLVEHGPTSMTGSPALLALLREVGLDADILQPPGLARRRFILRNSTLHVLPQSPPALLRSRLLSPRGKARALAEPLIARASATRPEESLGALVRRRFGREILDYVVDPFVSGVYAGNPDSLSSRYALRVLDELEQQHGSVLIGVVKSMQARNGNAGPHIVSFRNGMQQLPLALARMLHAPPKLGTRAVGIAQTDTGWRIQHTGMHSGEVEASELIVAVPAHALDAITWPSHLQRALAQLTHIAHAPVCTVALGFKKSQVSHALNGFGALVPSVEQKRILGVLFNSTMFPNRAPDGCVLLTCFVGGARAAHAPTEREAVDCALQELQPLLGVTGNPALVSPACWPQGIPQFEVGYGSVLTAVAAAEESASGIHFTGSWRSGVAIGDCVQHGLSCGSSAALAAVPAPRLLAPSI